MTSAAPYFEAEAKGPADGAASWLRTEDGLRLRAGVWGRDAKKGTVLIFPGRTEYVEKYGFLATESLNRGYASLAVDWRGQGLADREPADRTVGHVNHFDEFQRDVAAVLSHARALGLPEPYYLIGHSMGGCIALRWVMDGAPVKAVAFSAPMWGLALSPALKTVARISTSVGYTFGLKHRFAPGQKPNPVPGIIDFAENLLTADRQMFDDFQAQIRAHPELGLGNASLGWLRAALMEMSALDRRPSPDLPCTTFLGLDEAIVSPSAIRDRMGRWDNGKLVELPNGRHEVLLEVPATRSRVHDELFALFGNHG